MDAAERDAWRQADRILDAILDLPPGQRAPQLAVLAPEPGLRQRIERLLAAHDAATGPLEQPLPMALLPEPQDALSGRQLGRWRLLEEIGRGGMAVVYRAVADHGAAGQIAAVKVLTLGALAEQGRERFLQEQQALLRLRHPYLVALYDAGVADDGTPWMAMALIEGERIDQWCVQRALDVQSRVRLLLQVCEALNYTHRNLVIHRDIKPSNVLVDHDGHVRLLDFGIARLVDDASERTATALRALTPEYAAPEQFAGSPPSTSMDVYGVGALLYRLLTEQPPHAQGHGKDSPTQPPSRAVRSAAQLPEVERKQRARRLRGDLDTVVMKALADKPEKRYASVEAFADDLQRWLSQRPIRAHPPSWRYRLGKFVIRHRAAMLALGVFVVLLAVAATQVVAQRNRAEAQAQRAVAVRDFLADVFQSTDPSTGTIPDALDLLNAGSRRARDELLQRDPLAAADVLLISGGARNALNDFARAQADLLLALDLLYRAKSPPARELSRVHWELGLLYKLRGMPKQWLQHDRLAVYWVRRWKAPAQERLTRELSLAAAVASVEPDGEGEALLRRLLVDIRAAGLANTQLHLDALNALTTHLARNQRNLAERIALHEQRVAVARRLFGKDNGWYAYTLADSVPTLRKSPVHLDRAEAIAREAVEISDRVYREPHMFAAVALCNLAALLAQRDRFQEALRYYDRSIALDEALQRGDLHTASCRYGRGKVRAELGDDRGALADLALDRAMLAKLDQERSVAWLRNCAAHAGVLGRQGRVAQAAALLDDCEARHRPDGDPPEEYLAARIQGAAHDRLPR